MADLVKLCNRPSTYAAVTGVVGVAALGAWGWPLVKPKVLGAAATASAWWLKPTRSESTHERVWADRTVDAPVEVGFEDLGGLDAQIDAVKQAIILPLTRPELFVGSRLARHPTSVLLHGPPGTGKTRLAAAVAKNCNATFIRVSCSDLLSKWVGESSHLVTGLFAYARTMAPTIIFLDECDAILCNRSSSGHDGARVYTTVVSTFLSCWDGIASASAREQGKVVVIAATNRREVIDPAIIRRFGTQVEIPLPNARARESILGVHLRGERTSADVNLPLLASLTDGFSGSRLRDVVASAASTCCRRTPQQEDFEFAEYEHIPQPVPITTEDLLSAVRALQAQAISMDPRGIAGRVPTLSAQ